GYGLALGITLTYLGLLVVIPLAALVVKAIGVRDFVETLTSARVVAAFGLSFGAALVAAAISTLFGVVVAWVLVRYEFPGRRALDVLVDLPFALPTAVAGIALAATWGPHGVLGRFLPLAYTRAGVVIALVFLGVPFVVRAVQPVLAKHDRRVEEAAATLGASPVQITWRVILPALRPAITTGFALAFARALGEYGSVVFISGNMPGKTEILPLLVMTKLEQYDYTGATALALVMVVVSFALLVLINSLGKPPKRRLPVARVIS
ncbi:MAG TPA: sulfate ABC transporter permease subunit CysT, partial [Kofleriaceae bacterium]